MNRGLLVLVLVGTLAASGGMAMEVKRVTTVVLTGDVDACARFWTERLGFEQTMAVPAQQPGQTGNQFAAVQNDRHELMFQSFASAEAELPGMFGAAKAQSFLLYVEVPDLDAAIERMKGLEPAISRRTTFYGSNEIGYRDPCGTIVVLAEFPEGQPEE